MSYQPNLSDPRVLKRVRQAYAYTIANFSEVESSHSMLAITRKFGQAQTDLAKWLMRKLLICTDHHYSNAAGLSKKYVINLEGALYIDSVLHGALDKAFTKDEVREIEETSLRHTVIAAMYTEDYKDELETGNFEYKDKSNRLWHPIQSMKKQYKRNLLKRNNYKHEYDIDCCAPTLLYQESLSRGGKRIELLEHYIANKEEVREVLSESLGITTDTVKMILNAVLNGARVGCNPNFSLYEALDGNEQVIRRLQRNEYIIAYKKAAKKMWKSIPIEKIPNKSASKLKWAVYFRLERTVLNAVKSYLEQTNNKCFTEHDGWTCAYEINEHDLKKYVKEKTGYNIALKHKLNDAYEDCTSERELSSELFGELVAESE